MREATSSGGLVFQVRRCCRSFQVNAPTGVDFSLLGEVPRRDLPFMLVPEALDLHVKIVDLRQEGKELAHHTIAWHLSPFVAYQIYERFGKEGDVHGGMSIHAPKSEIDRTVRVIDRAVKIIDIHCAVDSRSCWFIQLNYNKNCHIYQ